MIAILVVRVQCFSIYWIFEIMFLHVILIKQINHWIKHFLEKMTKLN